MCPSYSYMWADILVRTLKNGDSVLLLIGLLIKEDTEVVVLLVVVVLIVVILLWYTDYVTVPGYIICNIVGLFQCMFTMAITTSTVTTPSCITTSISNAMLPLVNIIVRILVYVW